MKVTQRLDEGFAELVDAITPEYSEPDGAEAHLNAIEHCLTDACRMEFLAPYGSTGHGTNLDGYSAIDCFAVIPKNELFEDSGESLRKVHGLLEPQFPEAYLTEGRPVIVLPFGDCPSLHHHVVPGFSAGTKDDQDVFGIPGPSDRWVEVTPGAHSAWINRLDRQFHHRFKPFVRMVKAWNFGAGAPIWSHYLEISAAEHLSVAGPTHPASDMASFFVYLLERRLAPFKNTVGSNEPVYGTDLASKFDAMDKVRKANEWAKMATFCERQGNTADAFYWWRKIFNYKFPAY